MLAPIRGDFANAGKAPRIPRAEASSRRRPGGGRVFALPQIALAGKPGQAHHDGPGLARGKLQRDEQSRAGAESAVGGRRRFEASAPGHVAPGHGQRVPPAAAKPGMIHLDRRFGYRRGKRAFLPRPFRRASTPQDKASFNRSHRLRVAVQGHEVFGIERKDRVLPGGRRDWQSDIPARQRAGTRCRRPPVQKGSSP